MTKTKLVSAITALALMAAPGAALAHGSHGKHHKRHAKKHQVRKAKIRQVVGAPASSTTPSTTTPAPAVTALIAAFDPKSGDLTITLSNGKSYTAAVTDKTKIECSPAAVPTARNASDDNDDQGDDQQAAGGREDDGDDDAGEHGQREHGDGDHNDDGHPDNGQVKCDASALAPGAKVTEAELKISLTGSAWKSLELVK